LLELGEAIWIAPYFGAILYWARLIQNIAASFVSVCIDSEGTDGNEPLKRTVLYAGI
jgi:hypothetical protein